MLITALITITRNMQIYGGYGVKESVTALQNYFPSQKWPGKFYLCSFMLQISQNVAKMITDNDNEPPGIFSQLAVC